MPNCFKLIISISSIIFSANAYSELNSPYESIGEKVLKSAQQNAQWTQFVISYEDAVSYNPQIDNVKLYTRSAQARANLGISYKVTDRLSLLGSGEILLTKTRTEDTSNQFLSEANYNQYYLNGGAIFTTPSAIKLFGGMGISHHPAFSRKTERVSVSNAQKNSTSTLTYNYFGLAKAGTSWTGGVYYIPESDEAKQLKDTYSTGNTLESESIIYQPTVFGLFLDFSVQSILGEFELASIQASHGGDKSEDGRFIYEDHNFFRIEILYPMTMGGYLDFELRHSSLAYSSSDFVNLETIPFSEFKASYTSGNKASHLEGGIIYGVGKDRQSKAEFNQNYEKSKISLIFAWLFSF